MRAVENGDLHWHPTVSAPGLADQATNVRRPDDLDVVAASEPLPQGASLVVRSSAIETGGQLGEVALEPGRRDEGKVGGDLVARIPEGVALPATDDAEPAGAVDALALVDEEAQASAEDIEGLVGVAMQVKWRAWGAAARRAPLKQRVGAVRLDMKNSHLGAEQHE